ncbi:hypothetical protein [Devosia lacusdianchii]|uniref:hypothetical protein n=1 Tax=Devosia lacusdianchii TaxID=2917991 RepID=UPI001F06E1C9|nr:hypothetical protein [Devosia sp. JXJ CY 41]
MLAFAGLGRKKPESIAFAGPDVVPRLEHLMGLPPNTLARHMHATLEDGRVDFFGVPLRDIFIERIPRRVSPAALRSSPYARAIWQIRTFGFDPETLDPLIAACPRCEQALGFKVTQGIAFCDHCREQTDLGFDVPTVDLRSIVQDPIHVEDREALDFVTSLIDPRFPDLDLSFLPTAFASFSRGELFEIVHAIAAATKMNVDGTDATKNFQRSMIGTIEPHLLAGAGRAILDWPNGFRLLLDEACRSSGDRPGEWGPRKAFGALALVHRDRFLPTDFNRLALETLSEHLALAAAMFGVGGKGTQRPAKFIPIKTIKTEILDNQEVLMRLASHSRIRRTQIGTSSKAPILLHEGQVRWTFVQYKDHVPLMTVALELGIPGDAVYDLVRRRHMFIYVGMSVDITALGHQLSKRSLAKLVGAIADGRPTGPLKPGFMSVSDAMSCFPAGRRPWVPLIERMLDGRLEYQFFKPVGRGLLKAVAVQGVESLLDELIAEQAELPAPKLDRVTAGTANLILGVADYRVYQALIQANQLSVSVDGSLDYREVLEYARNHILPPEIAARGRRSSRQVRSWMDAHGIQPTLDLGVAGGVVYRRQDVEPLLEFQYDRQYA